jgi:hypothetical protein
MLGLANAGENVPLLNRAAAEFVVPLPVLVPDPDVPDVPELPEALQPPAMLPLDEPDVVEPVLVVPVVDVPVPVARTIGVVIVDPVVLSEAS